MCVVWARWWVESSAACSTRLRLWCVRAVIHDARANWNCNAVRAMRALLALCAFQNNCVRDGHSLVLLVTPASWLPDSFALPPGIHAYSHRLRPHPVPIYLVKYLVGEV